MAFDFFDKDKYGYIEGSEVLGIVEKVSRACGLAKAPTPAVNLIFDKVAGSDGRLDLAEFRTLLKQASTAGVGHRDECALAQLST